MRLPGLLSDGPLRLGGPRKSLLMLGNRPIGRLLGPHGDTTVLIAHVGAAHSVGELVASLVGHRPTALLALQGPDGESPVAAHLKAGQLAGLVGAGSLDQLGPWAMEFQRRHGVQSEVGDVSTDLRRLFLCERWLEALAVADRPAAALVFVQGGIAWLGEEHEESQHVPFHHLLLEYARRKDELPRVEAKLGGIDVIPIPLSEPGPFPSVAYRRLGDDAPERDFHEDLDDAALQEWLDARRVFRLCDGASSVRGLAQHSMLGRFRTCSAVIALAERNHVALIPNTDVVDEVGAATPST